MPAGGLVEEAVGGGRGGSGVRAGAPEWGGPGTLVDPFQDQHLGFVCLCAGYGGGDADQLLPVQ
jgi:hypothetical protein